MNKNSLIKVICFILMLSLFLAACSTSSESTSTTAGESSPTIMPQPTTAVETTGPSSNSISQNVEVSFSKDIEPIFQASCVSCHGGERTSKGLDLKSYASVNTGSQNGPVVIPGDAANSKLLVSIISGKMPKRGTKLTQDQILLIQNWINSGAKNN